MAQGALDLSDPLNRLNALPTAVNWRGEWSPTIVYYRNDIVVSPLTAGTYINIIPSTTILGGADPSINAVAWYAFGIGAGGLEEITGSEYITVGPTTTPKITNNGVITLDIGRNLNNLTSDQFPTLEDTGVNSILANPGILVTPGSAGPTITNTGVTQIVAYPLSGLAFGTGTGNVTIQYTGKQSVNSLPGSGITVGTGQSPLVTNTGLLSLAVGAGLANISTPQTPNIINTGVLDISGSGITVTGFPSIELSTLHPSVSLIGTLVNAVMTPPSLVNQVGRIPITQIPGSVWATSIATQTPYSSGTFIINLYLSILQLGKVVQPASGILARASISYTIYDSVNNVAYTPAEGGANTILYPRFNPTIPYDPNFVTPVITSIVVDLQTLWTSGFRIMTDIQIKQDGGRGALGTSIQSATTNVFATYSSSVLKGRR